MKYAYYVLIIFYERVPFLVFVASIKFPLKTENKLYPRPVHWTQKYVWVTFLAVVFTSISFVWIEKVNKKTRVCVWLEIINIVVVYQNKFQGTFIRLFVMLSTMAIFHKKLSTCILLYFNKMSYVRDTAINPVICYLYVPI